MLRRCVPFLSALAFVAAAQAQTFSNPAPITILDSRPASLYPSPIEVSGAPTAVGTVRLTLHGVSHTFVGDIAAMLVAPDGRGFGVFIPCDNRDGANVFNADWTFSGSAIARLGRSFDGVGTGEYGVEACPGRGLPPPAPSPPYNADLNNLAGINPNGVWRLYIADTASGDVGAVAGGWSISFSDETAFTYQGRLDQAGVPFEGPANLQFRLFDGPVGGSPLGATLAADPTVTRGLFAVQLDFGLVAHVSDEPRWLEIAVNGQTLAPRQALRSAPRANFALAARNAERADVAVSARNADTAGAAVSAQTAARVPAGGYGDDFLPGVALRVGFTAGIDEGGNSHIELNNNGLGTPYLDFSRSGFSDFDGRIILADASTLQIQAPNVRVVGNFINNSDARDKRDVRPLRDALSLVSGLRGVRYFWNERSQDGSPLPRNEQIGFLAQEVERVLPELVATDESGRKGVSYVGVVPVLTEAVKQLREENAELRRRLEALEARTPTPTPAPTPAPSPTTR